MTTKPKFSRKRIYRDACSESKDWLDRQQDFETAWNACHRPDWMLWTLEQIRYNDQKQLRLFACWCAEFTPLGDGRTSWDLLTDERSRTAVVVSRQFANCEEIDESALHAARSASRSASRSVTRSVTRSALHAAESASWSAAESAAESAARAQADALHAAELATWAAARAQADALRTFVPNPFAGNEVRR